MRVRSGWWREGIVLLMGLFLVSACAAGGWNQAGGSGAEHVEIARVPTPEGGPGSGAVGGGREYTPPPGTGHITSGVAELGTDPVQAPTDPIQDIFFDFDQALIKPAAKEVLSKNVAWLLENPRAKVTIEGHCDERGTNEYNLGLGERRASAVRDYLVGGGVPRDRIIVISYGEERPFVKGEGERFWQWNRRAHFALSGGPHEVSLSR
ncbi:MAG: peptidoglycan-associated lipoprotein Pal [Candidatus Methylomirabilales bacterium]